MEAKDYSTKSLGKNIKWEYDWPTKKGKRHVVHLGKVTKFSIDTTGENHFLTARFEGINRDVNIAPTDVVYSSAINALADIEFTIIN